MLPRMVVFSMSRNVTYQLTIKCEPPHEKYDRVIPFQWRPSPEEIWHSIRRIRSQAVNDGVEDVVKVRTMGLAKVTDIYLIGLDLRTINEQKVL